MLQLWLLFVVVDGCYGRCVYSYCCWLLRLFGAVVTCCDCCLLLLLFFAFVVCCFCCLVQLLFVVFVCCGCLLHLFVVVVGCICLLWLCVVIVFVVDLLLVLVVVFAAFCMSSEDVALLIEFSKPHT